MKSICKSLSTATFIIGLIGSFSIAYMSGMKFNGFGLERDWLSTIIIFLIAFIMFSAISVILYSIGEVLENQEIINVRVEGIEKKIVKLLDHTTSSSPLINQSSFTPVVNNADEKLSQISLKEEVPSAPALQLDAHEDLIKVFSSLASSKEIYDYIVQYNSDHENMISDKITQEAFKYTKSERLYGNMKQDLLISLRNISKEKL